MKDTTFLNEVHIEYPDDFSEMNGDEIRRYFAGDMLRWGARSSEKHIILSVGKTKTSLMSMLLNAKDVLSGAEKTLSRGLKDYKRTEEFKTELSGITAEGIRFEYTADDKNVRQYSEMYVVKVKCSFYTVHCISWLSDADKYSALFSEFRQSIKFV